MGKTLWVIIFLLLFPKDDVLTGLTGDLPVHPQLPTGNASGGQCVAITGRALSVFSKVH